MAAHAQTSPNHHSQKTKSHRSEAGPGVTAHTFQHQMAEELLTIQSRSPRTRPAHQSHCVLCILYCRKHFTVVLLLLHISRTKHHEKPFYQFSKNALDSEISCPFALIPSGNNSTLGLKLKVGKDG